MLGLDQSGLNNPTGFVDTASPGWAAGSGATGPSDAARPGDAPRPDTTAAGPAEASGLLPLSIHYPCSPPSIKSGRGASYGP